MQYDIWRTPNKFNKFPELPQKHDTMIARPRTHFTRQLEARKSRFLSPYPSAGLVPHILPRHFSVIERFNSWVYCGQFFRDGEYFLCACQSGNITVYRVGTGEEGMTMENSYMCRDVQWSITDMKLSPDSRHIAYSSWSGNVHLIPFQDTSGGTELCLPLSDAMSSFYYALCAFSLSFSADGKELIAGTNDGKVIIYDLQSDTKAVIVGHATDVNSISFSDQTNHVIYSAADDGILKIWDRRILNESNPEPVSVFVGHVHGITFHDSKGDFRYLLTNSKDQSIKLWDTRRPSQTSSVEDAQRVVRINSQMWDYRQFSNVAPGYGTEKCHQYLMKKRETFERAEVDDSVQSYTGHSVSTTLLRARFSPAYSTLQKYIYTGSVTGKLYIYDVLSGDIVFQSKRGQCHSHIVRDVSWHPYEPMIFTSSLDQLLGCTMYNSHPFSYEPLDEESVLI